MLAFCTGVLLIGKYRLGLDIGALQTLAMLALVFGGEGALYALRERQHCGAHAPADGLLSRRLAIS
jgi:H+-transporting ATPase